MSIVVGGDTEKVTDDTCVVGVTKVVKKVGNTVVEGLTVAKTVVDNKVVATTEANL